MVVDLSLPALINSAGAVFFVAIGLFALYFAKRSRRAQMVGVAAIAFGLQRVVTNIYHDFGSETFVLAHTLSMALSGALLFVVAWSFTRGLSITSRRLFLGMVGFLAVGVGLTAYFSLRDLSVFPLIFSQIEVSPALMWNQVAFSAEMAAGVLIGAAAGLRARELPPEARNERRALALLAVAFGSYGLFYAAPFHGLWLQIAPAWFASIVVASAWLLPARHGDTSPARNATLALQAAALAGLLFWGPVLWVVSDGRADSDLGTAGAIRTIGAFLLVLAILRYDLLGVAIPRWGGDRAPLAAAAVAATFIVAEIAQNFFAAEYGLLMGGLVAGALLFAARPIERAMERRPEAARPSAAAVAARERSYVTAAQRFLRDGHLSREEERELMILAEHLGIPASRAYELRDAVEEARQRR